MKVFIAALATLAMVTPAASQTFLWNPSPGRQLPETVPWSIKEVPVGTATVGPDNRMYLRWFGGAHAATMVFNSDSAKVIYDPSGKIIDQVPTQ